MWQGATTIRLAECLPAHGPCRLSIPLDMAFPLLAPAGITP